MTKIRVRLGSAEAEVESDPEHLKEAIELISEVAAKLPGVAVLGAEAPRSGATEQAREGSNPGSVGHFPAIGVEKGDSLADVIDKFFADPWGRERRKLSDVREALQTYGMNYPKQSVAVALLRLAKASRIRRFKAEDGEFVYTASSMPAPAGPQMVVEPGANEESAQNLI